MYCTFDGHISTDLAPCGSLCENTGCSKRAEQRMTIIGGGRHNVSRLFCYSCGEKFACTFTNVVHILTVKDGYRSEDAQPYSENRYVMEIGAYYD